jgi:hypothetical protein
MRVGKHVNPELVHQIMTRLAHVSVEKSKILVYRMKNFKSRHIGPGFEKEVVLEIAMWRSRADYLRHLGAPYVKQCLEINPAFMENDTAKF